MAATPIDQLLKLPFAWKSYRSDATVEAVLEDAQANIFKGHGREHTKHLYLSFDGADQVRLRAAIGELAAAMHDAKRQLEEAERYRQSGSSGGRIICFFLSATGYQRLGVDAAKVPSDATFRTGMKASQVKLADPHEKQWDEPFQAVVDALVLIADDSEAAAEKGVATWRKPFEAAGAKLLAIDTGAAIKRPVAGKREGIEHFGYIDGRSQPLFLSEDVAKEDKAVWDPAFPPSQFLIRDPGGAAETSLGSYFVFRKLEQNVKGFKDREEALAEELGLAGDDAKRAGAMVVGRFEDGTPLVLASSAKDETPFNDFDYRNDTEGKRCPFIAHIRKTNPRGESPEQGVPTTVEQERGHIMARRGMTYGSRQVDAEGTPVDRPVGGVGLMFMAYMRDIKNQFEFTQATWANNADFVKDGTGIDAVIGQGSQLSPLAWSDGWSNPPKTTADFDFSGFVTLKGGEYFFAPSLSFLRNL